jgi:hypothetical protein
MPSPFCFFSGMIFGVTITIMHNMCHFRCLVGEDTVRRYRKMKLWETGNLISQDSCS